MAEEPKKIIVDDDWKAQARKEKEQLADTVESGGGQALPGPSFEELINLVVMQALAGLGLLAGPGGERIPPNLDMAKHFIDLLQVLEDKTRGNLTPDEKRLLDQVLYEMRMNYVQIASMAGAAATVPSGPLPGSPGAPRGS